MTMIHTFSTDRETLISALRSLPKETGGHFLAVRCGCGKPYLFPTESDIPDSSLQCGCGEWIVLYEDQR